MKLDCYFIMIKLNLPQYNIFSFFACFLALLLSRHFCLLTCAFALLAERRLSINVFLWVACASIGWYSKLLWCKICSLFTMPWCWNQKIMIMSLLDKAYRDDAYWIYLFCLINFIHTWSIAWKLLHNFPANTKHWAMQTVTPIISLSADTVWGIAYLLLFYQLLSCTYQIFLWLAVEVSNCLLVSIMCCLMFQSEVQLALAKVCNVIDEKEMDCEPLDLWSLKMVWYSSIRMIIKQQGNYFQCQNCNFHSTKHSSWPLDCWSSRCLLECSPIHTGMVESTPQCSRASQLRIW